MTTESWEWIHLNWWTPDNKLRRLLNLLRIVEKNSHNPKTTMRGWQQSWITNLEENGLRYGGKFFFGLQVLWKTMRDTTMTYWGTPEETKAKRLSQLWKEFERSWRNTYDWWWIIITSNLEKNYRITPERLEESGKILRKDLWVRAHSKETPLKWFKREDCTGWIKWLEWDNILESSWTTAEWKHESSRYLEHSGTIE